MPNSGPARVQWQATEATMRNLLLLLVVVVVDVVVVVGWLARPKQKVPMMQGNSGGITRT